MLPVLAKDSVMKSWKTLKQFTYFFHIQDFFVSLEQIGEFKKKAKKKSNHNIINISITVDPEFHSTLIGKSLIT